MCNDETWTEMVKHLESQGEQRFEAEQKRMRELGILDRTGKPLRRELPQDMKDCSSTSVAT